MSIDMNATARLLLLLGSLNAALVVMLGAFAAHALKMKLSEQMLAVYQTAIQYHLFHSLGLLLIGTLALYLPASNWLKFAGLLMFSGIILFSGSLYLLALGGSRWLGAITPFGGMAFILAWLALTIAVVKSS